jgi:carbamate kinase
VERRWTVARDGAFFRRVVASPEPKAIVELAAIEALIDAGAIVICAGGGGIPVVPGSGGLRGVEAVIDKDLTAALLAEQTGAARLIMLTDVSHVESDWGTATAAPIASASPDELRHFSFAAGSMGPKVEAACRFAERTGREAVIGSLAELESVARGEAGTRVAVAAGVRS